MIERRAFVPTSPRLQFGGARLESHRVDGPSKSFTLEAYAVWVQPTSSNADIWFASLAPGGNSWSANTKISDDPGTADQLQPEIGVDGAGTILVAWDDWRVSPHQLRVRKRPAGSSTWSPSVVVAADGANYPSLSVRSDGAALLAWYDGFNATAPNVWTSDYDPTSGSWSAP